MKLPGKVVVVTGGASGIGRALCLRFAADGAAAVVVADLSGDGAAATAADITAGGGSAIAVACDVSKEPDVVSLIERASGTFGPIDLLCSNAGIATGGGVEASNEEWETIWHVNVMAHVYAVRAVLPQMLARGEGYLLHTASAAGLLTNLGAAPYAVTKHAVVALAEWLAITHADAGIKVSCLCPQGVRTPMLLGGLDDTAGAVVLAGGGLLEPEQVAAEVVAGLADERFLILPHPEVLGYFRAKAGDYDRWLRGMAKLQARVQASLAGRPSRP
jgi:NAD(P)-dependent dehydrogenase (short-subunit alcohol dehydrogenase family)